MANPEHVKIVKQGVWSTLLWRAKHEEDILDLSGADLSEADLSGAHLIDANLSGANLSGAKLLNARIVEADLSKADLNGAELIIANLARTNLSVANLKKANLSMANLSMANLSRANLTETNLSWATFNGADLSMTNLANARCLNTVFADCNLYQAQGLQKVKHEGPSCIGIDTMITSFRAAGNKLTPELETFFKGAGVPNKLLDALPDIVKEVKYHSCFISYGEPDKKFAQKLCHDLETKGVSCWLYSTDATPGKRTWSEIGQQRRDKEKVVVLCSAQALVRDGMLKEIEEQIDEDPDKMVPISLDNLWKEPGFLVMRANRNLKPFLVERNYAGFSGAIPYDEALEKLLKGLERKQVKPKRQRKQS